MSLLRRKRMDFQKQFASSYRRLPKFLGIVDLTALGIGATIGTGIFVLTGIAAARYAGPAVALSFVISGIAAALAALVYAEMSAAVPVAGSAHTYVYVTLGEFLAWMVGWSLVLGYGVAAGAVASGWSAYLASLLASVHIHLPPAFTSSPVQGGIVNLPAALLPLFITYLLIRGAQQGATFNRIVVLVKLAVILVFLAVGVLRVDPSNWTPFFPLGLMGAIKGAAVIFFAYIGFDAVATAAEEVKNPQRNLPLGIIASLGISTVLYILVALVLTGLVSYKYLDTAAPIAQALLAVGIRWGSLLVSLGALTGLASVLFATTFALSRVLFAIGRDGLLPEWLSKVHPRHRSPYRITIAVGLFVSLVGALLPVAAIAEMANIGVLSAFFFTSLAALALENKVPREKLPFRAPLSPYLPTISALVSAYLAFNLSRLAWIRFTLWFALGIVIYFGYGYKHSHLNQTGQPPAGPLQPRPLFKRRP